MPYPSSLSLVTLSGTFIKALSTAPAPATGEVTITSPVWLQGPADNQIIEPVNVTIPLDETGSFSIALPPTDDPDWIPSGWTYKISIKADGKTLNATLALPAASPEVNLADVLSQVVVPTPGISFIPLTQKAQAGGVASLGLDGKVPSTQLPAGSVGGSISWDDVEDKPVVFPPSAHTHDWADIQDRPAIPVPPVFARAVMSAGDFMVGADASWVPIPGLTLTIPAAVGDDVELSVDCLLDANGSATDGYEMVVVASGGGVARFASTNTGTPNTAGPGEGDPAAYPAGAGQRFQHFSAGMGFTVAAGDLTGGNVVFGIAHKGSGGGKVFASTAYPFRWRARNDH